MDTNWLDTNWYTVYILIGVYVYLSQWILPISNYMYILANWCTVF